MIDVLLWCAAACLFGGILVLSVAHAQTLPGTSLKEERKRFPVDAANVIAAMQRVQLPTQDVQVRMAMPITALSANPQLIVQAVMPAGKQEIRLRLSCSDHSECLPFFATAIYPGTTRPGLLPAKLEHHAQTALSTEDPAKRLPAAAANGSAREDTAGSDASDRPIVLKIGSTAMLDIEGDRVHIRVEVICLQSGAPGDKIRVTTRDHKQVYVGQVVTPTLLKSNL